jgi:hypothetical protein
MSQGVKYDSGKPDLSLIPKEALWKVGEVLTYGANKYPDRFNWRKGMSWSRVISASLRHITAFTEREDKDPETNLSHIAHAVCNLMFLLEYEKSYPKLDDRYGEKAKREVGSGVPKRRAKAVEKRKQKSKKAAGSSKQSGKKSGERGTRARGGSSRRAF